MWLYIHLESEGENAFVSELLVRNGLCIKALSVAGNCLQVWSGVAAPRMTAVGIGNDTVERDNNNCRTTPDAMGSNRARSRSEGTCDDQDSLALRIIKLLNEDQVIAKLKHILF